MSRSPQQATACQSCPFRLTNLGKRVPKGVYTEANLRRLWRGLSEGERLACFEQESLEDVQECSASLLLVARHLELLKRSSEQYRELALTPLTPKGVSRWIGRLASRAEASQLNDSATTLSVPPSSADSGVGVPWSCPVTNGAANAG